MSLAKLQIKCVSVCVGQKFGYCVQISRGGGRVARRLDLVMCALN